MPECRIAAIEIAMCRSKDGQFQLIREKLDAAGFNRDARVTSRLDRASHDRVYTQTVEDIHEYKQNLVIDAIERMNAGPIPAFLRGSSSLMGKRVPFPELRERLMLTALQTKGQITYNAKPQGAK